MRIIPSSAMPEPVRQILAELESKGYEFTCYQKKNGETFIQFSDEVKIIDTDEVEPCDTVIYIKKVVSLKPPRDSDYAIFATFICHGIEGNKAESFNKEVDTLNYKNLLGKFVRDCDDEVRYILCFTNEGESFLISEDQSESQDILYVTNHCVTHLNSEVVEARLEYHNKMKSKVFPMLEKLRNS
ncbi:MULTISPECIES: hypothetical protein [unclassified Microcoleus]|uniref:hypothetical protein n=1 Tax=unclassified Microcoleus TaxID=2642155 RepID=UPI0025E497AE|nr:MULTISPECIES: hypothetical protein [unclassified Microcoleus]